MEGRGLAGDHHRPAAFHHLRLLPLPNIDGSLPTRRSTSAGPRSHPDDARGLDRSELGSFLFAAERVDRAHAALAVLFGLNGLRVSEACSADIENLGFERAHRTLPHDDEKGEDKDLRREGLGVEDARRHGH